MREQSKDKVRLEHIVQAIERIKRYTSENTQETNKSTQEMILDEIRKHPFTTREQLAKVIGITPDGIKKQSDKMKKAKLIKHVGPTKGGHWEIITEQSEKVPCADRQENSASLKRLTNASSVWKCASEIIATHFRDASSQEHIKSEPKAFLYSDPIHSRWVFFRISCNSPITPGPNRIHTRCPNSPTRPNPTIQTILLGPAFWIGMRGGSSTVNTG